MAVVRWSWLGDHLALDLANTLRRRGMRYRDLLTTPQDLGEWLDHEAGRVTRPTQADDQLLAAVVQLRDTALPLLRAAATAMPLPETNRDQLNDLATRYPAARLLGPTAGTGTYQAHRAADPATALLAELTAAVIDVLTRPSVANIALCDAPGCGQLYHRHRPNQQWCNPHCGARARTERHHQRTARPSISN